MEFRETQVANPKRCSQPLTEAVMLIDKKLSKYPNNASLWFERGMALVEDKMMREAVESYSRAIALDPFNGLYYCYRAHRHLSCWEFSEACADFVLASRFIPQNWDVWYHLGLSYYLLKDYEKAAKAYEVCYQIDASNSKRVAVINWYYVTLKRLGLDEKANQLLLEIRDDMECSPYDSFYYEMLKVHQGKINPNAYVENSKDAFFEVTYYYGLANYYLFLNDMDHYQAYLNKVIKVGEKDWWSSFGYLAASVDLGLSK